METQSLIGSMQGKIKNIPKIHPLDSAKSLFKKVSRTQNIHQIQQDWNVDLRGLDCERVFKPILVGEFSEPTDRRA